MSSPNNYYTFNCQKPHDRIFKYDEISIYDIILYII